MTPAAKAVLLLTLNVERCPKFSLKCKQLWHFITKFAVVFQNTPSYKLRGHFHLPLGVFQLQVEPPLSCWSWGEGDVKTTGVSASGITPSFPAWQWSFAWGNVGFPHGAAEKESKQRANAACGSDGPCLSFQAFQELHRAPTWVWGMGGDRKDAQVLLNACSGVNLFQTRVWG